MITNAVERVHTSRLLTYRADFDGKVFSPDLLKHIAHSETKYELVGELVDIDGNKKDEFSPLVMWKGLPDRSDWTWQQFDELYEDVLPLVRTFCLCILARTSVYEGKRPVFIQFMTPVKQSSSGMHDNTISAIRIFLCSRFDTFL